MAKVSILGPLNEGHPLQVLRMPDGNLCIPDAGTRQVWVGHDFAPQPVSGHARFPRVDIPSIPAQYGEWVSKAVGGVSNTVRRNNILRATDSKKCAAAFLTVFAIQSKDADAVGALLTERAAPSIAEVVTQWQCEENGHCTEIRVHDAKDVHFVAALVARAGAIPVLEDADADMQRPLGVERLDRIESHSMAAYDRRTLEEGNAYGCRRGSENWKFVGCPAEWQYLPLTWDYMVKNIPDDVKLGTLPQPLRQHVARHRLEAGKHEPVGSQWFLLRDSMTEEELRTDRFFQDVDPSFLQALSEGRTTFSAGEVEAWRLGQAVPDRTTVRLPDGRCFRARDTKYPLARYTEASKRKVSAALQPAQSRQLIEVFYLLAVERVSEPVELVKALHLIAYRYLVERGYMARWMGKYNQNAVHVGNGNHVRKFPTLKQYRSDQLPAKVINKLCSREGKLKGRGSKGSRAKYPKKGTPMYFPDPERRFMRSSDAEKEMRGPDPFKEEA